MPGYNTYKNWPTINLENIQCSKCGRWGYWRRTNKFELRCACGHIQKVDPESKKVKK